VIVLDVREAVMFGRGHIPRARLAPMEALRDLVPQLTAAHQQIVTYCDCPAEEASARAADYLRRRAVPDVKALLGGWEKWVASGEAIEK
jgi:rhodanese-related sulfurtransferase